MVTKLNHFVPRYYLEKFNDDVAGGVWVYDKDGDDPKPIPPAVLGAEKYLYTIKTPDGERDDTLEKWFADQERSTWPIIDRWAEPKERIKDAEKPSVAIFLAYMHTRVPRNIEVISEMTVAGYLERAKQLGEDRGRFKELYDSFLEETGREDMPPAEIMRETARELDAHFDITTNRTYALGLSLAMTELFYETMGQLEWSLCDAPSGSVFVTGDSPVASVAFTEDGYAQFGANLVSPRFEISFPITPTVALYLTRKSRQKRWRCNGGFVKDLNRRTAYMAERFVFSRHRSSSVAALVNEASFTRTTPKIDKEEARRLFREFLERNDI